MNRLIADARIRISGENLKEIVITQPIVMAVIIALLSAVELLGSILVIVKIGKY